MVPQKSPVTGEVQDQSIKTRKQLLYDGEAVPEPEPDPNHRARTVQDFLRETPAPPLPRSIRASLWGGGGLVALLFAASLMSAASHRQPDVSGGGRRPLASSRSNPAPPSIEAPSPSPGDLSKSEAGRSKGDEEVAKAKGKANKKNKKKDAEPDDLADPEPTAVDPAAIAWRVAADPPAEAPVTLAEDLTIPVPMGEGDGGKVILPATPSPFVALGDNHEADAVRECWDLRSRLRAGLIRGALPIRPPLVLSPDGALLAGKANQGGLAIVWAFNNAGGREVKRIRLKSESTDYLEFAGPDRLIVADEPGDGQVFRVWAIPTAKLVHAFRVPVPVDHATLAPSPGRRFLAMCSVADRRAWIYALATGEPAGVASLPLNLDARATCLGMAFSDDGAELAGLFETVDGLRVVSWGAADGQIVADHVLEGRVRRSRNDAARALAWLPDRSGWLVHGQALFDHETGQNIFNLPAFNRLYPDLPRDLVAGDRYLTAYGNGRGRELKAVPLDSEKIAKVRDRVKSGGYAVDAVLPPPRKPDWSTRRSAPSAATAWSVEPDPAHRPARPPSYRQVQLRNPVEEVLSVLPTDGDASPPEALVATRTISRASSGGLAGSQVHTLERYDLVTGRLEARVDVPAVLDLIDVSPQGDRLAFRDTEDRGRLDVYHQEQIRHMVGWRPYEQEEADGARAIAWAAFLDQHHVLTSNAAGKLIYWTLPGCGAGFVVEGAIEGRPILSPGRKVLAGLSGGSIRFYDTSNGRLLGEAPAPSGDGSGPAGLTAAAFSDDGTQLVALLHGNLLVRYDLRAGKVLSEFRPGAIGSTLEWCGPRHILIDGRTLIDLEHRGLVVWTYTQGGLPMRGSPDGRHWAVVEPFPGKPGHLAPFGLPDKSVEAATALFLNPKTDAPLRPGVSVALNVEVRGAGGDEADRLRDAVRSHLAARLAARNVQIDPQSDVSLAARFDLSDTREFFQPPGGVPLALDKKGKPKKNQPKGPPPVPVQRLDFEINLATPTGPIPIVPRRTIVPRDLDDFQVPGDLKDLPAYQTRRLLQAAEAQVARIEVPALLDRQPSGIVRFPGSTDLSREVR